MNKMRLQLFAVSDLADKDAEIEKYRKRVAELEAKKEAEAIQAEMKKQVSKILKRDYGIEPTEEVVSLVVGADAKTTKANIETLVKLIGNNALFIREEKPAEPEKYYVNPWADTSGQSDRGGSKGKKGDPYQAVVNRYRGKK